jgi:putative transposase
VGVQVSCCKDTQVPEKVDMGRRQNFTNQHFWARGFFVSTVGKDEAVIREYIKTQEKEDQRIDQLNLIE